MVEVGRAEAARRDVTNVRWSVGRAEDLDAPLAAASLVTIGEAFHRLDQPLIAARALAWLKPGGALATLGADNFLAGNEPWRRILSEVARRWMAPDHASARPGAESGPGGHARVLADAGFTGITDHTSDEPRDWSLDQIIGYLHSTSVCSRRALGADAAAFEDELRAALPRGPFHETMRWGYTLGFKPR